MKQNLFKYITFTLIFAVLGQVYAQTVGSASKSRLGTGKTTEVRRSTAQQFSMLNVLPTSDRSLSPKRSTAINSFYRSILLAPTIATINTPKNTASTEVTSSFANDSRSKVVDEVSKADDKMFVNDRIIVDNVFPNPANDFAEIEYKIVASSTEASISLYGSVYSKIADFTLDKNERSLRIPTRDLPSAVYYYQLTVDGKKVATKKLIVRH